MTPDTRKNLETLLKTFGAAAYWYGEETGDYDMVFLFDTAGEDTKKFQYFTDQIIALTSEQESN